MFHDWYRRTPALDVCFCLSRRAEGAAGATRRKGHRAAQRSRSHACVAESFAYRYPRDGCRGAVKTRVSAIRPATGKISAIKTGSVLLLLLAIWVTFIVLSPQQEVAHKIPAPESALALKLRAVGLPNNSDLGGLPEIFSIWADKAEWKDGRAKFAYWHPVMKTYAYFFQAIRVDGRVRFEEISEPHDQGYRWDESLPDDCPIRFYTSANEPGPIGERGPTRYSILPPPVANHGKVEIDMLTPKILPPPIPSSVTDTTY